MIFWGIRCSSWVLGEEFAHFLFYRHLASSVYYWYFVLMEHMQKSIVKPCQLNNWNANFNLELN